MGSRRVQGAKPREEEGLPRVVHNRLSRATPCNNSTVVYCSVHASLAYTSRFSQLLVHGNIVIRYYAATSTLHSVPVFSASSCVMQHSSSPE